MRRPRLPTALAALAVAGSLAVGVAAPAAAHDRGPDGATTVAAADHHDHPHGHDHNRGRPHRLPERIEASAPALHPEGVAWDPTRGAFLVSSVTKGTVSVVSPDGTVETLIDDPRLVSTLGLKVDARRNRVLVTYADLGMGERSSPETLQQQSGLAIYDLATGEPLHLVALEDVTAPRGANDGTVARDGTAYVTDTIGDALFRVSPSGEADLLVQDERFTSDSFGVNGIVWHPAGFLLTARYDTGQLFKVPLDAPEELVEVDVDGELAGADGLLLRRDGSLIVVTNSLAGDRDPALLTVRGRRGWETARVVDRGVWPEPEPTTATATPSGVYAVSGRLDVVLGGGTEDTFVLRRR